MNDIQSISAPAKIILLGEHAVVYNQPAIAVPVPQLRAHCVITPADEFSIIAENTGTTLNLKLITEQVNDALSLIVTTTLKFLDKPAPSISLRLSSDIPIASGLGSGAAVSAVVCKALALAYDIELSTETINQLVYQVEKLHHGTPSGIDNTVIVYEKPVYYRRSEPITVFEVNKPFKFLIADTGEKALTHMSVGDVRQLYLHEQKKYTTIFEEIGRLVVQGKSALLEGDSQTLGKLMNQNQILLRELTVSSESLERLIDSALKSGALGAKLSGGGRGGNMIALVDETSEQEVHKALSQAGATKIIRFTLPTLHR